MPDRSTILSATYRLQINSKFTLKDASRLPEYLGRLGISHVYLSPIFQAGPESTHGYDVCGFDRVSSAVGGLEGLKTLSARLQEFGIGLILDMVPNHMGNDLSNEWWIDVLANGQESKYATWFDIDWEPSGLGYRGKVLLPILEDRYPKVLAQGKLSVVPKGNGFGLAYYDHLFPLNEAGLAKVRAALESLPSPEEALKRLNGSVDEPRSFKLLHQIIRLQHYRLAYWKNAPEEINYRRFFDVNTLVAMRMESEPVFEATHALTFELARQGILTGLRIDHPDGLWDPKQYFDRLHARHPMYLVVEKILTGNEPLPNNWSVEGTTGYDFLNKLNGIFVDAEKEEAWTETYIQFMGRDPQQPPSLCFHGLAAECKRLVLRKSFTRELNVLTDNLQSIVSRALSGCDFTESEIRAAIGEIVCWFPVYRTYVREDSEKLTRSDQQAVAKACDLAIANLPACREVIEFIRSLLLLEMPDDFDELAREECKKFLMRFQQLTGPVMAKGLEDTAFYRHNRLLSLNEVGGEPAKFGTTIAEFHEHNLNKREHWPRSLLATATHDTKRGEDLRARLNVLPEMVESWRLAMEKWASQNTSHKTEVAGYPAPDRNDEYLIYQTIIGAWPPKQKLAEPTFVDRICQCVQKSIKEAKRHTSWTEPNSAYEQATEQFVRRILGESHFVSSLVALLGPLAFHGMINSLSQVVLKATAPGIPDFYQGAELWDFNLVDPDNRRDVDFHTRDTLLQQLERDFRTPGVVKIEQLLSDWPSATVKMFVTWKLLNFKRQNPELFSEGTYVALKVEGAKARHVCAFARLRDRSTMLVTVPRFTFTLASGADQFPMGKNFWGETAIEFPGEEHRPMKNLFTGETLKINGRIEVSTLLSRFVVGAFVGF